MDCSFEEGDGIRSGGRIVAQASESAALCAATVLDYGSAAPEIAEGGGMVGCSPYSGEKLSLENTVYGQTIQLSLESKATRSDTPQGTERVAA